MEIVSIKWTENYRKLPKINIYRYFTTLIRKTILFSSKFLVVSFTAAAAATRTSLNRCCAFRLLQRYPILCRPPVSSSYSLPPQADNGPTAAAQRSAATAAGGPPAGMLRPNIYPPGAIPVRYVVPPGPPTAYSAAAATNGQQTGKQHNAPPNKSVAS